MAGSSRTARGLFRFVMVLGALGAAVCGCSREDAVVLYSSADDYVLREVVDAFRAETGVRVELLGDTEATKTTGLVQRLLSEQERPRADVWWSSEPFGTIRLAREGVLEPAPGARTGVDGGWPLHARDHSWYGFGARARVIAYHTGRIAEEDAPSTLRELTDPRWRGRVGMARPEFGTTRGHMAAIMHEFGPEALEGWLRAMKENGLRIYSGNATAVRAIVDGEIDICLTDTDDVWVAQRNGWPVSLRYEARDGPGTRAGGLPSLGPLLIPNTVALVRGGPAPRERAMLLLEFLLGEQGERLLAESDSGNIPVRPGLADAYPQYAVPDAWMPDLEAVADLDAEAMEVCRRVLGGG